MNESVDHDQRFKEMLREFFPAFLALFFPAYARRFDFSQVEWWDKELLPNPPDGTRHILDLVGKLRASEPVTPSAGPDSAEWLALVHVEIESADSTTDVESRLPGYYRHLREKYRLPVLPVVLYLTVGLDGIGTRTVTDTFWELEVETTTYLYVGLKALDAATYAAGDNWLGVALSALMRMPREMRVEFGADLLRRLGAAPLTDHQKFLLGDCVQAYLEIDDADQERFRRIIEANATGRILSMQRNKTLYDLALERNLEEGLQKGIELGAEEGETRASRAAVTELAEAKFGPLPAEVSERVAATDDRALLRRWLIAAGTTAALAEFRAVTGL